MNTAEPRSKQKTMGEWAKGENNYQESANKKTLNDRKQKNFGATFGRLTQTSKHVTSSFHKNWKGRFKNIKGLSIGDFSHLLLPSPPSLSCLFRPRFGFSAAGSLTLPIATTEKKKEANKKTASHALAELHKPFNSL